MKKSLAFLIAVLFTGAQLQAQMETARHGQKGCSADNPESKN